MPVADPKTGLHDADCLHCKEPIHWRHNRWVHGSDMRSDESPHPYGTPSCRAWSRSRGQFDDNLLPSYRATPLIAKPL